MPSHSRTDPVVKHVAIFPPENKVERRTSCASPPAAEELKRASDGHPFFTADDMQEPERWDGMS